MRDGFWDYAIPPRRQCRKAPSHNSTDRGKVMLKNIAAALPLLALLAAPGEAQNGAAPDAMSLIRAADAAIGASRVHSIHYAGQDGYVTVYGQSGTSSVQHQWPRYNL